MIKLVFFGTGTLACSVLNALIDASDIEILALITQPDKPAGRGKKLQAPPIKKLTQHHELPILQFPKLRDEAIEEIKKLGSDIFVVAEYGLLIPRAVLDLPAHGTLNVHPSLLPKYRGASPIQSAILAGEKETGVSIMLLDEEMDHGPVLVQETLSIDDDDSAPTLEAKLGRLGAQLIAVALPQWVAGKHEAKQQDHDSATYCTKISRDDGRIDWNLSADEIYRRFRAYLPWPGIFTEWNGKRLKLTHISPPPSRGGGRGEGDQNKTPLPVPLPQGERGRTPGTIFLDGDKLYIATGDGTIVVDRLQLEGKKEMDAQAFMNGYSNFVDTIL